MFTGRRGGCGPLELHGRQGGVGEGSRVSSTLFAVTVVLTAVVVNGCGSGPGPAAPSVQASTSSPSTSLATAAV